MSCVNLQSDNSNCGTCNRACPSGQSCVTGSCTVVCSVGQTNCGSACVDTQTSNSNCGACGTTCSGGTSCLAGRCSCPTGQTLCSAACVNTQTSNSHCGACGVACGAGTSCVAGSCRPANDDRANAQALTLTAAELTVTGTTVGATPDGPTDCGGALNNVWYSVTLGAAEVLYVDTAGSAYDTRISLVSSAGVTVANSCNDDAFCTTGGFTNSNQSRTAALLSAGTYYLNVSGFSASAVGAFTLHVQHLPRAVGSFFYDTPLTGSNSSSTVLVGASSTSGTCGGTASGEDVRWFLTCGAQMQFFSLCRSDTVAGVMATYSRRIGTTAYDPAMYLRSAQTGAEVACNDDGTTMGATNCAGTGTGADTLNFGSRLNNVVAPRGLNAVFVDERAGGTGMTYTLVYTVR